jgi:hypothetical protein
MDLSRERVCPSCAAPAQTPQRWCLECGAELPQPRRSGLRPTVGIATTLAVLVGAASAGGYTLLRHDRQPPPAATTVAQAPPAATVPSTLPPATQEPPSGYPSTPLPLPSTPQTSPTTPLTHTSSVPYSKQTTTHDSGGAGSTTPKPQLALANVALGAAAVAYAPYAADTVDLGDASLIVDGTTRTGWRTPAFADPTARPQLGVYVDLASAVKVRKLVLETSTPGMSVEVYGAVKGPPSSITDSGWDHLATRDGLASKKTAIALPNRAFRYILVWIVGLPPGAHTAAISELSLLSLQPE